MPSKINGFVLQRPVDTEKGDEATWAFVSGELIRVPIFRYDLASDDPDYLCVMSMQMQEHIRKLELLIKSDKKLRKLIMLRKVLPADKKLYMGVMFRVL